MISDATFKSLTHTCKGFVPLLKGQSLAPGYKPDYVLLSEDDYIILESENTTSRKLFIGAMMKAAHFLQGQKEGILIFVMVERENTTAVSIAAQLKTYLEWMANKTNLKAVYVIRAQDYCTDNVTLLIAGEKFIRHSIKVSNPHH